MAYRARADFIWCRIGVASETAKATKVELHVAEMSASPVNQWLCENSIVIAGQDSSIRASHRLPSPPRKTAYILPSASTVRHWFCTP